MQGCETPDQAQVDAELIRLPALRQISRCSAYPVSLAARCQRSWLNRSWFRRWHQGRVLPCPGCLLWNLQVRACEGERLKRELTWGQIERSAGFPRGKIQRVEKGSVSFKQRRVGEFDWVLLRKAATLNAPTDIALTFADYIDRKNADARRFEQLTEPTIRFVQEMEAVASAPVTLISTRFHERSIIDRRAW